MTPTDFLIHVKTVLAGLAEMNGVPVIIDEGQLSLIEDVREATELGLMGLSVLVAETGTSSVNCRGRQVMLKFGVSVYQSCLTEEGVEASGARLRDVIFSALHLSSLSLNDCNDRICFKSGQVIEHSDKGETCGTIYAMGFEVRITYSGYVAPVVPVGP